MQLAELELGVIEIRNINDHPRISAFASRVKNRQVINSEPWCGYFVGFIFLIAEVPDIRKKVKYMSIAASWFDNPKRVVWRDGRNTRLGRSPRPGDLVGYRNKSGRIYHVGIIVSWDDNGRFVSIEGNTSWRQTVERDSSVNDGVRRKNRRQSQAYIVCDLVEDVA